MGSSRGLQARFPPLPTRWIC